MSKKVAIQSACTKNRRLKFKISKSANSREHFFQEFFSTLLNEAATRQERR